MVIYLKESHQDTQYMTLINLMHQIYNKIQAT